MINKIKKYLKFMVCLTLIFGLIAPSYAGLSASDGSVFITKSEFDAAFTDFNVRLTTFEAGINSKIDSQVTSYLDRNGIWSGKDQTLLKPELSTGIKAFKNGRNNFFSDGIPGSGGARDVYSGKSNSASINISFSKEKKYDFIFFNEKITTSDKAGMLYVIYELTSKSALPKDKRMGWTPGGVSSYYDAIQVGKGTKNNEFTMRTYDSANPVTTTLLSFDEMMAINQLNNYISNAAFYSGYPSFMRGSASFFVSQGDDIWIRWYAEITTGGSGDTTLDLSFLGPYIETGQSPLLSIRVLKIY